MRLPGRRLDKGGMWEKAVGQLETVEKIDVRCADREKSC
jgi:hypothetical protein